MKILEMVKLNDGVAFVVDEMPKLTYEYMKVPMSVCKDSYEKFEYGGRGLLVGTDETGAFMDVLYHKVESGGRKAFGGREFSLPLKEGSMLKTDGWWWDGGSIIAGRMLGIEIRPAAVMDYKSLVRCFVFSAMRINLNRFEELFYLPFLKERGTDTPRDYTEYEKEMRAKRIEELGKV